MVGQDSRDGQESTVAQFYNKKTVFVTGATGFMGKVLVEKLLRSTQVEKIYVLIRPKKGVQTKVRLQELLSAKIFDQLKESSPKSISRVEAVNGDITEPNFGLSEDDERRLVGEVSVVFHSAATVNFNEALTKAVNLNVVAVFTIMEICKKMKKLEALVHVSTAYCNTQFKHIEEEIYDVNGDPVAIINLCKRMDPSLLNSPKMTAQIIGNKPNTYAFTKALGESALVAEGGSLPIVIVRPSIVIAAWKEPLPGWVENLSTTTGIIAGFGKGVMRTAYIKREMIADVVPVDIPINLAIAAAWKTASQPSNAIPVYNCTSGSINPISWGNMFALGMKSMRKYPFENVLWYPGGSCKDYAIVNKIYEVALHSAPAYMLDTAAWVMGKKQVMRSVVAKMHKGREVTEFFATNEWKWSNDNMKKLNIELTDVDRKTFNFDLSTLNWPDFLDDYIKGTRQYFFKEDLVTLAEARRHSDKMFWIEKCLQIFLLIVFARLFAWVFC